MVRQRHLAGTSTPLRIAPFTRTTIPTLTLIVSTLTTLAGAEIIKLNDPVPQTMDRGIVSYVVSPDDQTAVYVMGEFISNDIAQTEVYSVPTAGGTSPTLLSSAPSGDAIGPLVLGSLYPRVSQDGQRVVYLSDAPRGMELETLLYSVPITGGAETPLSAQLPANEKAGSFKLVPGSDLVVYLGGDESSPSTTFDLYSVPVDGSTSPVNLTSTVATQPLSNFEITPDGSRVVFIVSDGGRNLFSVPVGGGTVEQLTTSNDLESYVQLPNSDTAIYQTRNGTTYELYTVALDGSSAPVRMHPPLGTDTSAFRPAVVSSDGTMAALLVLNFGSGASQTYIAQTDGSGFNLAHPGTYEGGLPFAFTQNDTRLLTNLETPGGNQRPHLVDVDGTDPELLSSPIGDSNSIGSAGVSTGNTGDYLFFLADVQGGSERELIRYNPADGTFVTPIMENMTFDTDDPVPTYDFSADDNVIAFVGQTDSAGPSNLYTYSFTEDRLTRINRDFPTNGNLSYSEALGFEFINSDSAVIYAAEQDVDFVAELYVNTQSVAPPATAQEIWQLYP
ncbi:MAG: hypothetical protein RLY93_14595 [Sumerlaeia bacterium]